MSDEAGGVLFSSAELMPEAWRAAAAAGPVRMFNPGLLREAAGGWLLAYRVVGADTSRRIALCRLDANFRVIPGSAVPFSDSVRFRTDGDYPEIAKTWFADPRLYLLEGRLWIYWNSGWHEPRNCQFLQELDRHTLRAVGFPRELCLQGERRKLEKNWTLFATADGSLRAVYAIEPHRVLAFSLEGEGDITFADLAQQEWKNAEYPVCHGGLRGGAPPVLHDGHYWSFCHSVHDDDGGYRYAPAVYAFSATAPHAPTFAPRRPLTLYTPRESRRTHERLNPAVGEVVYPCGAAHDGARWIISHGLNDEYCALSFVSHVTVAAATFPVASPLMA